jgi:hypothetical protein
MRSKSQETRFRRVRIMDEYGRPWSARQEIATGTPSDVAPLFRPVRLGSGAVVLPPATYHRFTVDNPGLMTFAQDEWEADVREAERRWQDRLLEIAKAMYADGWVQAAENPSRVLLEAVGPKPIIPLDIVRACTAKNPWALGLDPRVPQWAAKFMEVPAALVRAERSEFPSAAEEESFLASVGETELAGVAAGVSVDDLDGDFTLSTSEPAKPRGRR